MPEIADDRAGQVPAAMILLPIPMTDPARYFAAALTGAVNVNRLWLREQKAAGTPVPPLYRSGVHYKEEENEAFCTIPAVQMRGWGDCDDLAAWRVAELNENGEPGARVHVRPSKSGVAGRWHAVVKRADGTEEDPSAKLGMGKGARLTYVIVPPSDDDDSEGYTRVTLHPPEGEPIEALGDDWQDAMAIAADELLRMSKLGLVPLSETQADSIAALAMTAKPAFQAALQNLNMSAFKGPAAMASTAIDSAVDMVPGGNLARNAVHAALSIFRASPRLRNMLPSFMR